MKKLLLVLMGVACLTGCGTKSADTPKSTVAESKEVVKEEISKADTEEMSKKTYTITPDALLSEIQGMASIAYSIRDAGFRWDLTTENTLSNYLYYSSQSTDISFVSKTNSGIYLVEGFDSPAFLDFLFASYRGLCNDLTLINCGVKGSFTYYEGTDAEIELSFENEDGDWYSVLFVNSANDPSKWLIQDFYTGRYNINKLHYKTDEDIEFDTGLDFAKVYADYVASNKIDIIGDIQLMDSNSDGVLEAVVPCSDGVRLLVASKDDVFVSGPYVDLMLEDCDRDTVEAFSVWDINGVWASDGKVLVQQELNISGGTTKVNTLDERSSGVGIPYDDVATVSGDGYNRVAEYSFTRDLSLLYSLGENEVYFIPEEICLIRKDDIIHTSGGVYACYDMNGDRYRDYYESPEKTVDYLAVYKDEDFDTKKPIARESEVEEYRQSFESYKSEQVLGLVEHPNKPQSADLTNTTMTEALRMYLSDTLADELSSKDWKGYAWKSGSGHVNALLYQNLTAPPYSCIFVIWDGSAYQHQQVNLLDCLTPPDGQEFDFPTQLSHVAVFDSKLLFYFDATIKGYDFKSDWPVSVDAEGFCNNMVCLMELPFDAEGLDFDCSYAYRLTFSKSGAGTMYLQVFDDAFETNEVHDGMNVTPVKDNVVFEESESGGYYTSSPEGSYVRNACRFGRWDLAGKGDAVKWMRPITFNPYREYRNDEWLDEYKEW